MIAAKPATDRLVTEALAKSGLLWITSTAGSAPVWHVHLAGVAYTVSGPGEQFSPEHLGRVEVVARSKESRARLVSFEADADVITPEDEVWEVATFALKAGRLNAPAHDIVARWAQECRVTRFTPDLATVVLRGERLDAPAQDDAETSATAEAEETTSRPAPAAARAASGSRATPAKNAAAGASPEAQTSPAAAQSAPAADLGTSAPGEPRPAAAAAEREHRAAVRAEEATPEPGGSSKPADPANAQPGVDRVNP